MSFRKSQIGFTLLEVLIAVAIFALVSSATFMMLQQTLRTGESFERKAAELVQLQRAHRLLQQDFSQAVPRSIRDEFGDALPAMMTEDASWGTAIELTRNGRPNPLNKARSSMQRVRYFFDGDKLLRRTWKHLDRAPDAKFQDQIILEPLKTWQIRLMDDQEWHDVWPVEDDSTKNMPRAVEVKISMENDRELRWLFSVSSSNDELKQP